MARTFPLSCADQGARTNFDRHIDFTLNNFQFKHDSYRKATAKFILKLQVLIKYNQNNLLKFLNMLLNAAHVLNSAVKNQGSKIVNLLFEDQIFKI